MLDILKIHASRSVLSVNDTKRKKAIMYITQYQGELPTAITKKSSRGLKEFIIVNYNSRKWPEFILIT